MEIIVGRHGNQPFAIADRSVSSKHLKVTTLANGKVQIEDLGSTNGTFVDGQRIIKKVVTPETIVTLGSSYQLRISDAIPVETPASGSKQPASKQRVAERIDISHLKRVWEDYDEAKKAILKDNATKQFDRMLPMMILGLIGVAISFLGFLGPYRFLITAITLIVAAVLTVRARSSQSDVSVKLVELDDQLKIDYICPKCKSFLGALPYENIKNRGCCPYCKSKWK